MVSGKNRLDRSAGSLANGVPVFQVHFARHRTLQRTCARLLALACGRHKLLRIRGLAFLRGVFSSRRGYFDVHQLHVIRI